MLQSTPRSRTGRPRVGREGRDDLSGQSLSRRAPGASAFLEERLAAARAGGDAHDLGQLPPGGGVGGEEAGGAGEDQGALLRARRPGVELADRGLVGLEPVELGVLGQQRVAERGDDAGRVAAGGEVPVDDGAGVVDAALLVPARRWTVEVRSRSLDGAGSGRRAAGTLRNRSR